MRVLIIGGAGFIGQKLAAKLASEGKIGADAVSELILADVVAAGASFAAAFPVRAVTVDLSKREAVATLLAEKPGLIFHLAAIVSGDAEQNFEKGYGINMDGTRNILEGIRLQEGYVPRLVFSSSMAVFGNPTPDPIPDTFHLTPRTSYGTQKAICELLVDDYTRKGHVDAVSIRFPTICVRPGKPNKAATGFFSGIIREPLSGSEAVLPVSREARHAMASPRKSVEFLLHAATLDTKLLADGRSITMPPIHVTVGEMIDALERVAGKETVSLIKSESDPLVTSIVNGWQFKFDAQKALKLGFKPNSNFEEIIKEHIDDELGGTVQAAKKQRV